MVDRLYSTSTKHSRFMDSYIHNYSIRSKSTSKSPPRNRSTEKNQSRLINKNQIPYEPKFIEYPDHNIKSNQSYDRQSITDCIRDYDENSDLPYYKSTDSSTNNGCLNTSADIIYEEAHESETVDNRVDSISQSRQNIYST